MFSGAGGGVFRRRRDLSLSLQIWLLIFFGLLSICSFSFPFSNPSRIFFPSALFNGERWWFPAAISSPQRLSALSLLQPHSTFSDAIFKVKTLSIAQLPFSKSGSAQISPEEFSHLASLMARDSSLGPSDAPCLVEAPTAHGDSFLWVVFTGLSGRIFVVKVEVLSFSIDSKSQSLTKLPSQSLTKLSSTPTTNSSLLSRHERTLNEAARRKLGFWLLGLVQFGPQVFSHRSKYKSGGPFLRTSSPRSVLIFPLVNLKLVLRRYIETTGRGLLLSNVSPSVQVLIIHHLIDLNHLHSSLAYRDRFQPQHEIIISHLRICDPKIILYSLTRPNQSFKRRMQFSSHRERSFLPPSFLKERTVPPWCISMKCHLLAIVPPRIHFIFVKAVASLEGALGIILMMNPCARRCFSKSMPQDVTRLSFWSLNTMSPLTHLSYATNSLSFSLESLSLLMLLQFKRFYILRRGWIIPSISCTLQV